MKEMFRNKKLPIVVAIIVVMLAAAGGGTYVVKSQKHQTNIPSESTEQQANLPTLKPSDIGMSLAPSRGGKSVTMTVAKLSGISSLDYEVVYTANSSGSDVPRGIIGHIDITPSDSEKSQEVVLGTCSDVCHYDTVVSPVKFSVKVTKSDGKVYEVDDSISL